MPLSIIALDFGYAILGVDCSEELQRGTCAVAIFIAALSLAIAMIIGNALD